MSFYIRKSINLGIIRINFAKHGVGFSVGVPGLRAGRSADGRWYVHAGREGLYYRKYIPKADRTQR